VQYLLMIYQREEEAPADEAPSPAVVLDGETAPSREDYERFNETYGAQGVLLGGAELQPTETATSVRVRNGDVLLTDGPFAETKEQLAGYYVIECETLDDAIRVAAAVPGARTGTIEIRPEVPGVGPSTA
jgi:hypothetical protein